MKIVEIDASDLHYTALNRSIRQAVSAGAKEITVRNIMGQRFIADGLKGDVSLFLHGVAGGDLAMFMSGPTLTLYGNADHAPGNTMDAGKVIIHGSAGDATAHSMRGGHVFVRDNIGVPWRDPYETVPWKSVLSLSSGAQPGLSSANTWPGMILD